MNPIAVLGLSAALCLVALVAPRQAQLVGWPSAPQLQPQPQLPQGQQLGQFGPAQLAAASLQAGTIEPQRQLIAPDLQNQVQALGAQLAAANRQIQFYQQQLAGQQQQQQQPPAALQQQIASQPLNQPDNLQQQQQQLQQLQQLQQQLQQQQQLQAALAQQQQQLGIQQQQQQQQPQFSAFAGSQQVGVQQQQPPAQFPSVQPQFQSAQQQQQQPQTLIDNSATAQLASNPRLAGQPQFFQQQQQQQELLQQLQAAQLQPSRSSLLSSEQQMASPQQQQQPTTSSSVEPASIEPSSAPQRPTVASAQHQQTQQAPQPAAKDEDKFSIGLGVLSPGYTQKFGNTALDFNQDKNSFSFTLSNRDHTNVPPPTQSQKPASN